MTVGISKKERNYINKSVIKYSKKNQIPKKVSPGTALKSCLQILPNVKSVNEKYNNQGNSRGIIIKKTNGEKEVIFRGKPIKKYEEMF